MGQDSPETVVTDWLNSPGHRIPMMRNANQYMGVGFYKAANGIYYWVQEFTEMNPNLLGSITFNANGGTINGKETYTITGTAGTYAWFYDVAWPGWSCRSQGR